MFQIGDWRLRIANLWKASCKLAAYEFTDNKTAGTSATSCFSCFGDPGCFNQLPKSFQANHVSRQLLRTGTAAAANYAEARGAESRADFIHKLRIVLKELNETAVWIQLILENSMIPPEKISGIIAENEELCRIIAASIKTAGGFERT
jgi:four helix bundle protein